MMTAAAPSPSDSEADTPAMSPTTAAGCWSSDDNLTLPPSSPEAETTSEETEIDETYWRKYPDLRPGSMTRELSGLEAANLNQELSEAVAAFKEEDVSSCWNIHDVCGEMHAE